MADRGDVMVDIDDELVRLIHQKLRVIPDEIASPTIYRVVPTIREMDSRAYDPQLISIGPFHQTKEALQPMERHKWRFLRDLIRRSPENSPEKYIQKLRSLEARARSCYSELVVPDDSNAFVEMMLLDACFIIEFLIEWHSGDDKMALLIVNWNLPLLRNDLLLLENQIPFCVLQSLYDLRVIPSLEEDGRPITLTEVAFYYVNKGDIDHVHPSIPSGSDVHHLLHLFHSSLRPTISSPNRSNAYQVTTHSAKRAIKNTKYLVSYSLYWLLSLFLYCRMPPPGEETSRAPRRIPSATELEDAGVEFKRKEADCILDVTFGNGTMEMPLLSIKAATIPLFRNLVAFEQCCPTAGSHLSAYSAFMYFLIDKPEDGALLVSCGILNSNQEEVAQFFQSLSNGVYLDYENHYLVGFFRDVNNYCASEIHRYRAIQRWRAMLMHDYFSKPWAIISLIAAFVLLILTMVQTFFAVLAYYRPPS